MPEIAEVEILRRELSPLRGQKLQNVEIEDVRLHLDASRLEGQKITGLLRHGKLLGFQGSSGDILTCHLRMTGSLSWQRKNHTRAVLHFEGRDLFFIDTRGFGRLQMTDTEHFGANLGPDLLNNTETLPNTWNKIRDSGRAIKAILLDQHILAGIGNYLADETLWRAQIHPQTPARLLEEQNWNRLWQTAHEIALEALAKGGVSIRDYRHIDSTRGQMQESLNAYSRAGKPCLRCSALLRQIEVAGRKSVFCPKCQQPPV